MIEWELREDITKRPPFLLGITKITSPPARNVDNFSQQETVFFFALFKTEWKLYFL